MRSISLIFVLELVLLFSLNIGLNPTFVAGQRPRECPNWMNHSKYDIPDAIEEFNAAVDKILPALIEDLVVLVNEAVEQCLFPNPFEKIVVSTTIQHIWTHELKQLISKADLNQLDDEEFKAVHCHLWTNADFRDLVNFLYCSGYPGIFDKINADYQLTGSECQVDYQGMANPDICLNADTLCPSRPPPTVGQHRPSNELHDDHTPIDCLEKFLADNIGRIAEILITPLYSLTNALTTPFRTHLGVQYIFSKILEPQKGVLFKSTKNHPAIQSIITALDTELTESPLINGILNIARNLATALGPLWPATLPSIPHKLSADLVLYLIEFLLWL